MNKKLLIGCIFIGQFLTAQNFQSVEEVNDYCSALGFMNNEEAEITVDRILDEIGLFRNFVLQECPNINNAIAKNIQTSGGEKVRYILYDNDFFNRIDQKAANDWASISILAHEIAHHLNGHSLNNKGSNHKFELEADFSSGFYLAKMGATLEEAQSAIRTLRYEKATATHPAKADRLKEIERGWRKAYKNIKTINDEPVIEVVKPSFFKAEEILTFNKNEKLTKNFFEDGGTKFNNKNYISSAVDFLKAYQYSNDGFYLYYSAVSLYWSKDYKKSIKRFQKLLDDGHTGGNIYKGINVNTGEEEIFFTETQLNLLVKAGSITNPQVVKNSKLLDMIKYVTACYRELDKNEIALKFLEDAHKYDVDKYDLIVEEANIYFKMGNNVRFREKMEEAIKYRPNEPKLYFNIGVIYQEVDNYYKARQYYEKTIDIDSTYGNAYTNIASLILKPENSIVEKMNNLGMTDEDNKEYERLKKRREELFIESIPYLKKAYQYAEDDETKNDSKNTLNNVFSVLGMKDKVID